MRTVSLVIATLTVGLMAGVYASFSFAVMPGLGRGSDHTFVEAMQRINVAILNGWFLICFLGGLVFGLAALGFSLASPGRPGLPWIAAGLGLYLVTLVVTFVVNVPLNNALVAAPLDGDVTAVRTAFEARWVAWNAVRAVVATAAFASLCTALVRS